MITIGIIVCVILFIIAQIVLIKHDFRKNPD